MKTYSEFIAESSLARLAFRGVRSAGRVARTADGGRRVTSAARAARNAKPRALATSGPPHDKYGAVTDYKDLNSDLAAFKKSRLKANKQDIRGRFHSRYEYSADQDPMMPKRYIFKEPESTHSTMITKYKNQGNYAHLQLPDKVGYQRNAEGNIKKVVRPSSGRRLFLNRLNRQMGGTRTSKPVADIEIATDTDRYSKNDPRDLIKRVKGFVNTLKKVPDRLRDAKIPPGSKASGHPSAVMSGETDKVAGREKRAGIYKKIAGTRMTSMDPVTQRLIGTVQ